MLRLTGRGSRADDSPPIVSKALPFIGHARELLGDRDALFRRGYEEHGEVFTVRAGPEDILVVTGADLTKKVLTAKEFDVGDGYRFLRPLIGDSFLAIQRDVHRNYRPVVRDMFSPVRLLRAADVMACQVDEQLTRIPFGQEVDVNSLVSQLVSDMLQKTFLGEREEIMREFWCAAEAVRQGLSPFYPAKLPFPLPRDRTRRLNRAIMFRIVSDALAKDQGCDPESASSSPVAELARSRKANGEQLSTEEVLDMTLGAMWGGHDTTSGQGAWLLALLAQNSEITQQLLPEVGGFTEDARDSDRLAARLHAMPLTAACVHEAVRLHPSSSSQLRVTTAPVSLGRYRVKAGQKVMTAAATTNYLNAEFAAPELFSPSRFVGNSIEGRQRGAIVGFGLGAHRCPGNAMALSALMILAATVVERCTLTLVSTAPTVVTGHGADQPSRIVIRFDKRAMNELQARPRRLAVCELPTQQQRDTVELLKPIVDHHETDTASSESSSAGGTSGNSAPVSTS